MEPHIFMCSIGNYKIVRQPTRPTHETWLSLGALMHAEHGSGPNAHVQNHSASEPKRVLKLVISTAELGMASHTFVWPFDHDDTLRWPALRKFSKEFLADRPQPQMDHLQRARPMCAKRCAWLSLLLWLNGPTRARRSAWPVHEMWFQQLRHHMFIWPTDYDGAIRWPVRRISSEVV